MEDLETWRTIMIKFELTEGTPNHHIRNCEFLALPAEEKALVVKVMGSGDETRGDSGEKYGGELPNGRRQLSVLSMGPLPPENRALSGNIGAWICVIMVV